MSRRKKLSPEVGAAAASTKTRQAAGAIASLLLGPGFGHLLVGRWRRAALWWSTLLVALALAPQALWPLLGWVVLTRIGDLVDIWLLRVESHELPSWGIAIAVVCGLLAVSFGINKGVKKFYVEAFKIPSAAMLPTLKVGDHVFVKKYDREVQRGDLVVFDNPCREGVTFVKRAVAVGGDTVEVRCSLLYVNGELAKREAADEACEYWDFYDESVGWELQDCSLFSETLAGREYQIIEDPSYPQRFEETMRGAANSEFSFSRDFPGYDAPHCPGPGGAADLGTIEVSGEPGTACEPERKYVVPKGHFFAMGDNRENSSDSRMWGAVPNDNVVGKVSYVWWSSGPKGETRWSRFGQALR